ncbi:hypothetical protein ACFL13_02655 [Patescibacteria group bacterium]
MEGTPLREYIDKMPPKWEEDMVRNEAEVAYGTLAVREKTGEPPIKAGNLRDTLTKEDWEKIPDNVMNKHESSESKRKAKRIR